MKKHLAVLTGAIAIVLMGSAVAWAQESAGTFSFRVEKGDTYTNLFGSDWEKAYHQNQMTLIRGGKSVTSPDILIEGSIVTVTPDVRFTARASARITYLNQQRNELRARLMKLNPKLAAVPAAAECRRILDDDLRFAADVDFAAREIAHLERLAQTQPAPVPPLPQPAPVQTWWIAVVAILVLMFAIALFWQRRRKTYPEGAARYHEAMADVRDAFNSASKA